MSTVIGNLRTETLSNFTILLRNFCHANMAFEEALELVENEDERVMLQKRAITELAQLVGASLQVVNAGDAQ